MNNIHKFLDISTGYMTEMDYDLTASYDFPRTCYNYPEGCFLHCGGFDTEDAEELLAYGMSKQFVDILLYANRQGCWFVRFDCDGADCDKFLREEW